VTLAIAHRTRRVPKNRFASGGAMVAVLGGDGSGKTTAVATLASRLGSEFDLRVVHMGKPPWSATTYAVRGMVKVAVLGMNGLQRLVPVASVRRFAVGVSTHRPLIWLVCTARDRQRVYRDARRFATNGGLVLCDRYPHSCLTSMDVPRIASLTAGSPTSRVVRTLIRLEERYHSAILPPELVVVLRVSPEIAVTRKTTESPETVRPRSAEVWNADWRASGARVIDANRSADAVARELEQLVWAALA
jgi:thymidylate kinase